MIGHVLTARVYDDRIELYLGAKRCDVLARVWRDKGKRARSVDYRHVIRSLQRKPMALKDLGPPRPALLPQRLPQSLRRGRG